MHAIEPHYLWRELYQSSDDPNSPFYDIEHDEMFFTNKVYNYIIHPQWDSFGSETLFLKIIFADYETGFCVIELIGEWNDCLYNDVMLLKREVIDLLTEAGIKHFLLIGEHVYNFHPDDYDYYEEWKDDVEDGWIFLLHFLPHVVEEMKDLNLDQWLFLEEKEVLWRKMKPNVLFQWVDERIHPTNAGYTPILG